MAEQEEEHKPVDDEELKRLAKETEEYDRRREEVIKQSRDVAKKAKSAIYKTHREERQKAKELIEEAASSAEKIINELVSGDATLRTGSLAGAMEELAEASIMEECVERGRVKKKKEMPVDMHRDEYVGGLLDFAGELHRYCLVKYASRMEEKKVKWCRDVCDQLMGGFLSFEFRNNALRKKFDTLKYTLTKFDGMLYDLSFSSHAPGTFLPKKRDRDDQGDGVRTEGEE